MNDSTSIPRRKFVGTMLAGALAPCYGSAFAGEDSFGLADKLVQFIVPFTPGTTPDLCARLFSPRLSERIGRTIVVENRPGASGIIGLGAVAKAAPDGHTLAFSTNTALTLPLVYSSVPFDVIESFSPVAMLGSTNFALCLHPSIGASTLAQFIDYVRRNPGKVNYGSPGKGTFHHLCMEMLTAQLGLDMVHVPYKGSAGATTDLLAGHIKAMFQPMHVAVPLQQEKRLEILGASRREQDPGYPAIAPLDKLGAPGYDADAWYAVWGPRGMKAQTVAAYNQEINRLLETSDVRATLVKQGVTPRPMKPQALADLSRAEFAKWQGVVKAAGITPE
ncbi:tripartite tricarboxylate transporter substrate-binding protein [Pigmentiphaga sp.]|uniref:Bug family tripartite tricarboxylate transporter substrate binding protein n=1 Tax=Pigmentiphaga sp. TaxID=1977564 RepID=UPI00128BB254|nr:tripartite tricarboxylate transporter substrate-binding protein [Pigmentiphaga sp.]MPS29218.1 tripartite tricarboxylate transporter substrate binding protein [Alcaligenaceae bacterium SAGV5]MPS54737.1 tripartite tricarboxylate transporter substrate binding protein [Alcaligenaceae bacterium SAGV3]MPT58461.1 tripartite tricarboxylate transporter substrate binding protein [Alcaligenaceae bacterium]